jgi:hypothetical protein
MLLLPPDVLMQPTDQQCFSNTQCVEQHMRPLADSSDMNMWCCCCCRPVSLPLIGAAVELACHMLLILTLVLCYIVQLNKTLLYLKPRSADAPAMRHQLGR